MIGFLDKNMIQIFNLSSVAFSINIFNRRTYFVYLWKSRRYVDVTYYHKYVKLSVKMSKMIWMTTGFEPCDVVIGRSVILRQALLTITLIWVFLFIFFFFIYVFMLIFVCCVLPKGE